MTCTQSATIAVGATLPPITLNVDVAAGAAALVTNFVSASAPPAVSGSATDPTNITVLQAPALLTPTNGQSGSPLGLSLTWSPVAAALSYDVYFGNTAAPVFVANVTGTSYAVASLTNATNYYWRVVSKNSSGTASSAIFSFRTVPSYTGFIFREDFETLSVYNYAPPLAAGVLLTSKNAPLWPEGNYSIATSPQAVHPLFCSFGDHTTGSGRMLVANGRGGVIESVYARTVSGLTPGVQYKLSVWAAGAYHDSPATLRFTLDGTPVGGTLTAPAPAAFCPAVATSGVWRQLTVTFTAQATQVAINLQDTNLTLSGNDFAIDDIELVPLAGGVTVFKDDFEVLSDYQYVAPLPAGTAAALYTAPLWPEGNYTIAQDPHATHPLFCSFPGRGGSGRMLIANGRGGKVESVWSRTVSGLTVGAQYKLSVWAAVVYHDSPPVLQFNLDGQAVGTPLVLSSAGAACPGTPASPLWQQLMVTFTAQSTQVVITLKDTNLNAGGNDFALDDIELVLN